jgi:hypothetical protein
MPSNWHQNGMVPSLYSRKLELSPITCSFPWVHRSMTFSMWINSRNTWAKKQFLTPNFPWLHHRERSKLLQLLFSSVAWYLEATVTMTYLYHHGSFSGRIWMQTKLPGRMRLSYRPHSRTSSPEFLCDGGVLSGPAPKQHWRRTSEIEQSREMFLLVRINGQDLRILIHLHPTVHCRHLDRFKFLLKLD